MSETTRSATPGDPVASAFVSDVRAHLTRDFPEAATWSPDFIRRCAETALEKLNRYNPQNPLSLQLNTVPDEYRTCVVVGGAVECLAAKLRDLTLSDRSPRLYESMMKFWKMQFDQLATNITHGVRPISLGSRGRRR